MKKINVMFITIAILCSSSFILNASDLKPTKILTYKTVERNGESYDMKLHVFNPPKVKSPKDLPCIVIFHSGGWSSGSPEKYYSECYDWSKQKMVAIAAEYSIRKVHNGTPFDSVTDGKSAIRWVRAHAKELGIDPNRIAAGGGSAGAHVAAAAAFTTAFDEEGEDLSISSKPNALVLRSPVFDNGPDGYGHSRVRSRWEEFSPVHNVKKGGPPTIVFIGSEEPKYIKVEAAEKFEKDMKSLGNRCELIVYKGESHGCRGAIKDIRSKGVKFLKKIKLL